MKNVRLSSALVIAILTIGITVGTQANPFGKRTLTRCFANITVTAGGPNVSFNSSTPCAHVKSAVSAGVKSIVAASVASSYNMGECSGQTSYCCVRLTETGSSEAVLLDLGEGLKRYEVSTPADVFCRN